jgi:hypothetical protein
MRHYLSTLHDRSPRHKKQFAFAVSSGFTLALFVVWTMVRFSPFTEAPSTLAADDTTRGLIVLEDNEIEPFDNIRSGLSSSFEAFGSIFKDAKKNVESVNLENEYQKVRSDSLNQMNTAPAGNTTSGNTIYYGN